jgi:hypothetical protein
MAEWFYLLVNTTIVVHNLIPTHMLKVCGRLACYTCNRSRFSSPIKFGNLKKSFNNISAISWRSVLLVEETRVPGENHRSAAGKSLTNFIT